MRYIFWRRIAVSMVSGMTKLTKRKNDFHLFVQVQRLALVFSWFLSISTPTFRPNIQPTPPPDWDENIWNMLLYFRFFTNANICFCKFNFFSHKCKHVFSQIQTDRYTNAIMCFPKYKCLTNKKIHFYKYKRIFSHICKHVSSQIQTDPITNTHVFTNKNTTKLFHVCK